MNITFDQAKAFCQVVDFGGYAKAAEKLNKSHSSLIYLIQNLESECGVELFNRKNYKNKLTPQGQTVYLKCLEILKKVDELKDVCIQFHDHWEASLKIIYDGILPLSPFIEIYKQFKNEHIPTQVQTYTDYLYDVESTFNKLEADIMISVVPVENQKLKRIFLNPIKMILVAHKDHPIHHKNKKWALSELQSFYFLTVRSVQNLGLNTHEFEQAASFYLSDFSFKKEAIMKKIGFGWLPQHLIENELQSKTLLPVKWERKSETQIQPVLYSRKTLQSGNALKLVTDLLTQE